MEHHKIGLQRYLLTITRLRLTNVDVRGHAITNYIRSRSRARSQSTIDHWRLGPRLRISGHAHNSVQSLVKVLPQKCVRWPTTEKCHCVNVGNLCRWTITAKKRRINLAQSYNYYLYGEQMNHLLQKNHTAMWLMSWPEITVNESMYVFKLIYDIWETQIKLILKSCV